MKVIYTEEKKNCYFIFYPPQQILSFDSIELPRKKKFLEQLLGMHLRVCLVDCNRYCNVIVIHMV